MPKAGMVTAVVGAAIGGSYLAGRSSLGLGIATGSGVLGGGTLGLIIPVFAIRNSAPGLELILPAMIGGAILGGTLGGIAGYKLASSTGAPAPVTAGGLALPYLIALVMTFD